MLNIFKVFTKTADNKVDPAVYNRDMGTLFDTISGLESQRNTLGGLTITPGIDSTGTFRVTDASGSTILAVDTVNQTVNITAPNVTITSGDFEVTTATNGLILKSPGGTRFRLQVADDGSLTTTSL